MKTTIYIRIPVLLFMIIAMMMPLQAQEVGSAAIARLPKSNPDPNFVVAKAGDSAITRGQINEMLFDSFALRILQQEIFLVLVRERAGAEGVQVTTEELVQAKNAALARLLPQGTPEQRLQALSQVLAQQRVSPLEYNMSIERGLYLRRLAELDLKVTEEDLEKAFRFKYGERVSVRHIQTRRLQDIEDARSRLESGEDFPKVAVAVSENRRTASNGGFLPEFARDTEAIPEEFREVAFKLEPGELSGAIRVKEFFHIIKLEKHIAPQDTDLDTVRADLTQEVKEQKLQVRMNSIAQETTQPSKFQILDPLLASRVQTGQGETPPPAVLGADGGTSNAGDSIAP